MISGVENSSVPVYVYTFVDSTVASRIRTQVATI